MSFLFVGVSSGCWGRFLPFRNANAVVVDRFWGRLRCWRLELRSFSAIMPLGASGRRMFGGSWRRGGCRRVGRPAAIQRLHVASIDS